VLTLHGLIAAFFWWQPSAQHLPSAAAAPQAFVVSVVAAPKMQPTELPVGPQQQETPPPTRAAQPISKNTIKAVSIRETLAKRPSEITLEQLKATEESTETPTEDVAVDEITIEPGNPTEVTKETKKDTPNQVKISQSSAPLAVDATKIDVSAAPQIGMLNEQHQQQVISWKSQLVSHLEQRKRYPRQAKSRHQEGVPWIRFTIDRQGNVLNVTLNRSSGVSSLDQEVIALIRRAQPLPIPPEHVEERALTMILPVEFFIQ
jgi:protein TonB